MQNGRTYDFYAYLNGDRREPARWPGRSRHLGRWNAAKGNLPDRIEIVLEAARMAVFLHPDSLPHRILTEFARYFVARPVAPILARVRRERDPGHRQVSGAFLRLRRGGLLEISGAGALRVAHPTSRGRKLLALSRLPRSDPRPAARQDLLVTYDIPRTLNSRRDLLRRRLRRLGFIGLHHSAWIGPAPARGPLLDYVRELGLTSLVHWAPWRRTRPLGR